MIVDLFSHKIHSSGDEWPEKLAELAAIFSEFDGHTYNRAAFEERLSRISPRASYVGSSTGRGDVSKFRDEISAYPAYLGLYFLEQSPSGWVVRMSETAKRFLVREEPDVASFLRLQLSLFQYPNAMGARYTSFTNRLHIQENASHRTLGFVSEGVHLSPLRLISLALKADAQLHSKSVLQAAVSYDEIFGLANSPELNQQALPSMSKVVSALDEIRHGKRSVPEKYESRFHTLRHTEIFVLERGTVRLRNGVNDADRDQLLRQIDAICSIDNQFNGFDDCTTGQDIEEVIASGEWGKYFDGVRMLPSEIVEALTSDRALEVVNREPPAVEDVPVLPRPMAEIYPLRERGRTPPPVRPFDRRREMADPELTRIKRQRRNLAHKELIDKMDLWLRSLGARPQENEHIDMFAKIPDDGSFIFEMKSGGDSILEQIRKGLSQLYEYRFRYSGMIGEGDVSLCLVLPESPTSIPWITEYLCKDREINVCWFEEGGNLAWPEACAERMVVMRASA